MPLVKGATLKLRKAGFPNMVIKKRLWGYSPEDCTLVCQTSRCFKTADDAVAAVLNGFRPTPGPYPTDPKWAQ